jgi:hypothetical protein
MVAGWSVARTQEFRKNLASGECQPGVMTALILNAIAAGIALVTLTPMQVYEWHARKNRIPDPPSVRHCSLAWDMPCRASINLTPVRLRPASSTTEHCG